MNTRSPSVLLIPGGFLYAFMKAILGRKIVKITLEPLSAIDEARRRGQTRARAEDDGISIVKRLSKLLHLG